MDNTVDAMAAAYDALVDAAAAAVREPGCAAALEDLKRRLDAFHECCDRAEDLVQAAATRLGPADPHAAVSGLDALCRTVHAVGQDLHGYREEKEKEMQAEETPVQVAAEHK